MIVKCDAHLTLHSPGVRWRDSPSLGLPIESQQIFRHDLGINITFITSVYFSIKMVENRVKDVKNNLS